MKPSLGEKRAREVKSAPATKPTVLARLSMLSAATAKPFQRTKSGNSSVTAAARAGAKATG